MRGPTIVVAAHKPYWMPSDELYVPVQVNAAAAKEAIEGYARDDEGDNISSKNGRYSELTALWWGWKNLDSEALGLAHYRRHFAGSGEREVLTGEEAAVLLNKAPVVLPKARNYVIESVSSHYAHTHDPAHLQALQTGIAAVSPAAMPTYDKLMTSTKVHMFNMLFMRRDVLDAYCIWLFNVLEATEKRIDFDQLSAFEQRCVGRLAEFLVDVWLRWQDVPYTEVALRELEGVNWVKKGRSFLAAKFLGKRYEQSF